MTHIIDYQIIDAVDASIYWKDLHGKYLGCNKYMEQMAAMNRDQIIGNTDYFLPWKDQANKIMEVDLLVMANRKKYEIEENIIINDVDRVFLSKKSPLFNENGHVIGIIGVSIDITHHKRFEQEFEKTENSLEKYSTIKNRFLRNISHEARIPLGSVLSISELLNNNWDKFDDKTKHQNMALIFKEVTRLSRFLINTFDASRFLKNEIQLELKQANFSQFLRDVITQYKKSFCDTKVNIIINHFDEYHFAFDQTLITRVIQNLLMNAIQYSPKNKKIMIGLYKSYLKNTEIPAVHCSITDEGIGIPNDELEVIFDSFTESSKTASNACGVGLGLSICKDIIEAHAGNIWAENNLLKSGSSFHFSIPTNLLPTSNNVDNHNQKHNHIYEYNNIIQKDLTTIYNISQKKSFALIGISPFNSYFSVEKILEICEWINKEYDDFAIFIPDKISRYTFEALGYTESRVGRKIKKQDNYTINKVNKALLEFTKNHPQKNKIKVHNISELKKHNAYKDLYYKYSKKFLYDKEFRKRCLETTKWVLQSNNTKNIEIEEFQKNIAVQYFLFELPVMTHANDILGIPSCDFVYHYIPNFLKHIYLSEELVSPKQRFLILK